MQLDLPAAEPPPTPLDAAEGPAVQLRVGRQARA
jgi:hypothetical protein